MASTKFFLDMRGKSKDGKGSLLIRILHNGSSTTVSTGIRVSPLNWNGQMIIKLPGAEALNATLQDKKSFIDKSIAVLSLEDDFHRKTAAELKADIIGGKQKMYHGHLISDVFKEYIDTGNLKEGTKKIYRQTLKKVIAFGGENAKVESINLKWLRSFDSFLAKSQGYNGRAIFLRSLRAVMNYAVHTKITTQYPFDSFQIKQEETRKRNISIEDLRKLYHFPVSKTTEKYRDYFFLMLFLIGINTIDLLLAKKSQVIDGRLEYTRAKTHKRYSIKLYPEAEALIKKYEGKGDYLLEAMDHCKNYVSFGREINDALKLIGHEEIELEYLDDLFSEPIEVKKVHPVIPGLTTYYARHTWSTLAHEIGVSSDVISMALGHSPTNRTTFIYIKPDQSKVDEANKRVIEYLLTSDEQS